MEEQIYKIIRIDEDDFGCEGRPEGQEPMVRVAWMENYWDAVDELEDME